MGRREKQMAQLDRMEADFRERFLALLHATVQHNRVLTFRIPQYADMRFERRLTCEESASLADLADDILALRWKLSIESKKSLADMYLDLCRTIEKKNHNTVGVRRLSERLLLVLQGHDPANEIT